MSGILGINMQSCVWGFLLEFHDSVLFILVPIRIETISPEADSGKVHYFRSFVEDPLETSHRLSQCKWKHE